MIAGRCLPGCQARASAIHRAASTAAAVPASGVIEVGEVVIWTYGNEGGSPNVALAWRRIRSSVSGEVPSPVSHHNVTNQEGGLMPDSGMRSQIPSTSSWSLLLIGCIVRYVHHHAFRRR